jgi:eukaryotic-like serine/threonine-protein kinase
MNEEEIFHQALARTSPAERAAYLEQACAGGPALRAGVEALLRANVGASGFLDPPAPALVATAEEQPLSERPGALIGPYKLIEQIGEGGMGTVWMAQQQEPVRRLVALKLIKAGLDSRQVVARFEAERQALALMDHPNIARVLDAGTTTGAPGGVSPGRPYFVMDLVKGVPITRFCDAHRLTPRQRLELFLPVCAAVQHAHTKGIIHRDLKPSNVLVALYDGRPVPKVIDFGVAKAAGQPLTDKTLVTGFGAIVGTLEYMSPEQAEINQLDIDTRSDIYALGVLLYELLTGSPPFAKKDLEAAGLLETLRVIREQEPTRPSKRLSTAEGLPTLAANRGTEPAKLTKLVRGELDWIVMKALEKDRGRRYETANSFALDVQRYLADEPVLACPPSAAYRLRKLVRRNRGVVTAASLVAVALLAGIVGTTVGLLQAQQRAEGERRAKESAQKRLAQIENGIGILGSIFEDLDPNAEEKEGRPLRAILGARLHQAAAELEGEAVGDPLVVARLQDRLGQSYLGLGDGTAAEALFTKAVTTRQAYLGTDDSLTLASKHNLALAYEAAGKRDEAIKLFEQVRATRVKVLGADHLDTLSTVNELATVYWHAGKPTEAIPLLEQVRDGRVKQLGEDHDHTLTTLQTLAGAYLTAQKHPEAIALAEEVWNARVKKHGDDHPQAIEAMGNLAYVYQGSYKMKQALALFEQARDKTVPKLGSYHPLTLKILHNLARMYRVYGRTPEAIALFEQVREREMMILGGYHPATLVTLLDLAVAYRDAGQLDKALPLAQQAAAGIEKLEFAHGESWRFISNLCDVHERLGQYDQAEVWLRKWLAVVREKDGPESTAYAWELARLGSNLLRQHRQTEAEPILRECLAIRRDKQPAAFETFHTQALLGAALLGQQKYANAEPLLVEGYQGMTESKDLGHRHHDPKTREGLTDALERLVQLYDAWGKPDEAAKWRKELAARGTDAGKTVNPNDR